MDRKREKLPMSPVAWAALNLFLREQGYDVKKINDSVSLRSDRRVRTKLANIILRYFSFPLKQKKLLKSLAIKVSLDLLDIKTETGTKSPEALIRDTKKRIKSYPILKKLIDIGSFRKGKKRFYYLKILSPQNFT